MTVTVCITTTRCSLTWCSAQSLGEMSEISGTLFLSCPQGSEGMLNPLFSVRVIALCPLHCFLRRDV